MDSESHTSPMSQNPTELGEDFRPEALIKKIKQQIPRSLPYYDNLEVTVDNEDPIVKELMKLRPQKPTLVLHRSQPIDESIENEILTYSARLQELLYLLLKETNLDDNIRISIESSLFDMSSYLPNHRALYYETGGLDSGDPTSPQQPLSKKQQQRKQNLLRPIQVSNMFLFPNNSLCRIIIDNYDYLIEFCSSYFNLSLASHITKFLVELIYNLQYWEVVHLVYMIPKFTYILKLIDFEVINTSFGPLIKPPITYLCDDMLLGLQYPFPYPFYNYSYHSFNSKADEDKLKRVRISSYLDISLKSEDQEPPLKKKRGRKPKVKPMTEELRDETTEIESKLATPGLQQDFSIHGTSPDDISSREATVSVKEEPEAEPTPTIDTVSSKPEPETYEISPTSVQQLPLPSLPPQQDQPQPTFAPPGPMHNVPPMYPMMQVIPPEHYQYYQYQMHPYQQQHPAQQPLPPQQTNPQQHQEGMQEQQTMDRHLQSNAQPSYPQPQQLPSLQPIMLPQQYQQGNEGGLPSIANLTGAPQQQQQQEQQPPMFPFHNQLKFVPQSPNRTQTGNSSNHPLGTESSTIDASPGLGASSSPENSFDTSSMLHVRQQHQLQGDISDSSMIIDEKGKKSKSRVIHQCHLTDPITLGKCLKIFYGKNELLRHQEFVHATKKKIYKCVYCSRNGAKVQSYPRHDSLARHIRRKHGVTGKENKMAVNYAKENVEVISDGPESPLEDDSTESGRTGYSEGTNVPPQPLFVSNAKGNYSGFLLFNKDSGVLEPMSDLQIEQHRQYQQQQQQQQPQQHQQQQQPQQHQQQHPQQPHNILPSIQTSLHGSVGSSSNQPMYSSMQGGPLPGIHYPPGVQSSSHMNPQQQQQQQQQQQSPTQKQSVKLPLIKELESFTSGNKPRNPGGIHHAMDIAYLNADGATNN